MKFWGKLRVGEKISADMTVESADLKSAVFSICQKFDLSKPVILDKHNNEMALFNRTVFLPDDFIENVMFDMLEIEKIVNRKKT